jgi:hypothetical protein
MILQYGVALYAFFGVLTAFAFVTFGVSLFLPHTATVTAGARILLLPGAAALWPYVLIRWVMGRAATKTRNAP